jgi:hypothetical protein
MLRAPELLAAEAIKVWSPWMDFSPHCYVQVTCVNDES